MFKRAYIGATLGIVWAWYDSDNDNEWDGLVDKELVNIEDNIKFKEGNWAQVCRWIKTPKRGAWAMQ